jgi:SAM-dependent methyltransferase
MVIRPSKIFLFEVLRKSIQAHPSAINIDAGAAGLKNRWMFTTGSYYGLDLDLQRLRNGIASEKATSNTFAIHADISHLEALPIGSAGCVVSTNTLYCLSIEDRLRALRQLCDLTTPNGVLLIELSNDEAFIQEEQILTQAFDSVDFFYFKNILSQWYESFFEQNGHLGSHPIAEKKPFKLIAWLISRIEYLTRCSPKRNKHVLLRCTKKRDQTAHSFDTSRLPLLEDRIYTLLSEK